MRRLRARDSRTPNHPTAAGPAPVSVVVCTRDRPDKLRRALASVLAQDLAAAEVIVANHGALELPADIAADAGLNALALGPRPTGAARAAGLTAAKFSYVAFCDDFDWWTPDHLKVLVTELEADPETALVHAGCAWVDANGKRTDPPSLGAMRGAAQSPFIFASGILVRAEAVRTVGGFDHHLNAWAEWDLALRLSDWYAIRDVERTLGWREVHPDRDELVPSSQDDRFRVAKYAMARQIRFPRHRPMRKPRTRTNRFDAQTWRDGHRELEVRSILNGRHSYPFVNRGLLPALKRQGVSIFFQRSEQDVAPEIGTYGDAEDGLRRIVFLYHTMRRPREAAIEPLVQYTMYEQDFFPRIHVEEINHYVSLLLVPCRQNLETMVRSGVEVPVKVLHHGVDPAVFPLLDRPDRDVFTFGTFGQQNERKGVDVLLRAFRDEFAPSEPVRLVLNATIAAQWITDLAPNVEVRSGFLDHAGVIEVLRELDVFVLPSRGEGFGLCGLEAMATGLPLIATNWSGPADYLDPADSYPLAFELVETGGREYHTMRLFGRWAEPSYEHLRGLMRRLYERQDEAREMGRRASARVHREWTWDRVARQLAGDLDLVAHGASPVSDASPADLSQRSGR